MGYRAEYHFPATLAETAALCEWFRGDLLFLAGGTEINSSGFLGTASHVVSLSSLPLRGIEMTGDGWIRIGALVTMQELIDSEMVPAVLKSGALGMANRNIRAMATIGGNIGAGKSCSSLLPALMALHARYETNSPADPLPTGLPDYAAHGMPPGVLITHISVPGPGSGIKTCYRKYSRTTNDLAVVSAAVSFVPAPEHPFSKAVVAIGGLGPRVQRISPIEDLLRSSHSIPDSETLLAMLQETARPVDDIRGSKTFKFLMAAELILDALRIAVGEGGNP